MFSNRLARQQKYGVSALVGAVGLLAGVMLATLANDTHAVAGRGAGVAADSSLGVGSTTAEAATATDGSTLTAGDSTATGDAPTASAAGGTGTAGKTSGGATSGGATAGTATTGNSGASAPGVTAKDIKIGVAYLDLAALAAIPQYKIVPGDKAIAAIYKGWKKRGEIPIYGRDVKLTLVAYNVLNPEDQRAACQRLVKDEKVFAVAAHTVFEAGSECVTKDEKVPLINPDPVPEAVLQAGAPYYFTLSMSADRMARNLVHFSKAKGLLDGKKIGLYYNDDNGTGTQIARVVKATLGQLGYSLAAEQKTQQTSAQAASGAPGPDDYLAVQRFQQAGVQMAFLIRTQGHFMQAADRQGYKPTYVNSDDAVGASNTAASAFPADQYDGTYAFTGTRREEITTGKLSPKAQQCLDDYAAETGDKIDVVERESEWGALSELCDVLYATLEGLKQAGPTLTRATYVQGLERVRGLQLAMQGVTSWAPGHHAGGDGYRTLLWKKEWKGYRVQQPFDFQPLWVP